MVTRGLHPWLLAIAALRLGIAGGESASETPPTKCCLAEEPFPSPHLGQEGEVLFPGEGFGGEALEGVDILGPGTGYNVGG
jgi:hypothetical protein